MSRGQWSGPGDLQEADFRQALHTGGLHQPKNKPGKVRRRKGLHISVKPEGRWTGWGPALAPELGARGLTTRGRAPCWEKGQGRALMV